MIQFQFTYREDNSKQIFVVVDIMNPLSQRFTIMDIRGGKENVDFFKKYFPWNLGSVIHKSEIEEWYKTVSNKFIGIEYGYTGGAINMDGGGGGKPNFYLIPPSMQGDIEVPLYVFFKNSIIEISGFLIQYHSETGEDLPDVSKVKINNNTYNVQFVFGGAEPELEPGVFYMGGDNIKITPEFIEQAALHGITIDLSNGNYIWNAVCRYLSDEIHGDLTATFYDSNGNGSSIVIKEYVKPAEEPDYLCFTAEKAGSTLRMVGEYTEGHENDFALEYSTDGETWQDLNFTSSDGALISDTLTFENIGDKVYFRGDNVKGTTDINMMLEESGYSLAFIGGERTQTNDNQFAVSGDIQTLVSKDGSNKTAGCFIYLFGRIGDGGSIAISTPPSCSATSLSIFCFFELFSRQESLLTPMDISNINVDANNANSFVRMYSGCEFNMTSDNGITLNGFGNIEYPINFENKNINNNFDFANLLLVNIYGFNIITLEAGSNDYDCGSVEANNIISYESGSVGVIWHYWIPTNGSATVILTAHPNSGCHFVKWVSSHNGVDWTDIPGATNTEYTTVFTEPNSNTYYFQAHFEQD